MELMKMVRWPLSQHKRKPKYVWLRKRKIINWVSSASEVIATWTSLHNALSFYMFDIFHSTTLKKKEGDTGLWVVLAHLCFYYSELARLPPLSGPLATWQGLSETRGHCSQYSRAWGRQIRFEVLLVKLGLYGKTLCGWASSYILILNQIENEISRGVEKKTKNKVVKNFCERGMKQ